MERTEKQSTEKKRRSFKEWMKLVWYWTYRLRRVWLALPVLVCAIVLAVRNTRILPASVGINLLEDGTYQFMVSRAMAVWVPLGVTVVCLGLMFLSKKIVYPWLISLFTLFVPVLLWILNIFPA